MLHTVAEGFVSPLGNINYYCQTRDSRSSAKESRHNPALNFPRKRQAVTSLPTLFSTGSRESLSTHDCSSPGHIATKRRRALDKGWDVAAQEAGDSQAHPVSFG